MIRPSLRALALALALSACSPPPPPPPPPQAVDPRVSVAPGMPLAVGNPQVSTQNGLMRTTLALRNVTDRDLPILVTTDWLDAQGRPMPTVMSLPQRMTVPRYGDAVVDSLAPHPSAAGFHIRLEPDSQ